MNKQLVVLSLVLWSSTGFVQAKGPVTTVPFTYQKGVPYIQVVSSEGPSRSMRFILDTGASPTVFNRLSLFGLNLEKFGVSGEPVDAPAMYVRQVRTTCGGISLKRIALSTDLADISMGCGHWVDGLLGTDYFRDKIVTIDFKHDLLTIQEPESKGVFAALFDDIPFCDRHDSAFVTIQTSKAKGPLVFLLDTGSTRTLIDLNLAKQLGMNLSSKAELIHIVGGNATAFEATNLAGSCNGYALPSKILAYDFSDLSWRYSKHIDGILGTDFLHAFTVHINFQTRDVHFD